ncbi:MAG: fibronectin type III domain-containing protein, partial [Bacteroidales bacterium]|nr:fibronectin type III domain-containing protein [Bacteroidales bacterium]
QMLYTSDLLTAMVGEPINKLTYYSSSADVSWGSAVFTVKLANVTETALAAGTGISATDTVPVYYSGSLSVVDNLMIVELDSSFTYTGGNLLVEITNVPGGYSSCSFYGNEVTGASLQGYDNNSLPAASSLSARDFMPKTTFEYGAITCPKPTGLACTPDSNQLSLTWVAGGNESQWLIYLNDSIVDLVNTNSVTITDLEANMPYTVGVRGLCDVDDTSMIVTLSVRTDCQLMQMPFFTSFENDPYGVFPPCYTRVLNYNTDPSVNTVYSHSGAQSMYLAASSSYNMFATQAVPLAGNQIKVNFWLLLNGTADYPSSLQAGVMTNPDSANSFIPLLNITDYNNAWSEYEFNTSSLNASTTYYVAFKFYGSSTYSSMSAIDDLSITQGDGCYSLMDVNIDTATLDEITLSWTPTGNAVSYDVAYNYGVKSLVTATMIGNVSGTQYTISGLSPNNAYYVWVRSICASGDTTMWRYVGLARTACEGYMNAPVFDDFSTYTSYTLPTCWSALATSGSGSYTYPYVYNTSANYHYLNFAPSYGSPNFVVMPYITLAANQMNIEVNGYADQS